MLFLEADSTCKCNRQRCPSVEEHLVRGPEAKGLSWPAIESVHRVLNFGHGDGGQSTLVLQGHWKPGSVAFVFTYIVKRFVCVTASASEARVA